MNIPSSKIKISFVIYAFLALCVFALFFLIKISPNKLLADERDFYPNIKVLQHFGYTFEFLRNIVGQSPGPLYQFIYEPLGHFIALTPLNMRYVNFLFLAGTIYFLYLLIQSNGTKNPFLIALLLLGLPMTWIVSGTALTEMPTLFFLLFSIHLLRKSLCGRSGYSLLLAATAGLLAGLAIIGRSPFLMVIPAAVVLFKDTENKVGVVIFIVTASILPCIVFYAWNGLVPPNVQNIQSGYQVGYFLLCIAYFCLMNIILYPTFFYVNKRHFYAAICLTAIAVTVNLLLIHLKYLPFNGVLKLARIDQGPHSNALEQLFPAIIPGVAYLFAVSFYNHIRNSRPDIWNLFLLASCMMILLTTIKSSAHFTSKYVIQGYPFFLIYISRNIIVNKWLLVRVMVGALIGIVSLCSYYVIHSALIN